MARFYTYLGSTPNPEDITSSQATLQVNNGQDLFLIGGNLNFDGGLIATLGGF